MTETLRWDGLVALGRVVRTHGRRGEVVVDPWTATPERFTRLSRVYVLGGDSAPVAMGVESARVHKGRPLMKLTGISDIGEAEALRGLELRIPESELEELPQGSFYQYRIRGFTVRDRSRGEIGVVENVLETGGTDVLVVRGPSGEENLVPLCADIVKNIDPLGERVDIDAPEGLVSVNAN